MLESKRVIFVTDLNSYAEGLARFQAVRELGCEVFGIPTAPRGPDERGYVPPSIVRRIAWRLGFPLDTMGTQPALLAKAASWSPDVVWIDKGNMIRPGTLARLKRLAPRAVLVSFSGDDMYLRHNRSRFYKWGLKHYDIVFTTKSLNARKEELPSFGARRVVFVNNAYDPAHHPIALGTEENKALGSDVGFIGTFEQARFDAMLFLAQRDIAVRVWGSRWESKIGAHPNLRIEGRNLVNTDKDLRYTKGICATRISLGFLRKKNRDLQTARSVEIPACGGFLLAERTDEHRRLFVEGKEAEFFASHEELLEKTR